MGKLETKKHSGRSDCKHRNTSRRVLVVFLLGAVSCAIPLLSNAQDEAQTVAPLQSEDGNLWDLCPADFVPPSLNYQPQSGKVAEEDDKTRVLADQVVAKELQQFQLSGNVQVSKGNLLIEADEVQYQRDNDILSTGGGVRFQAENLLILGDSARINLTAKSGTIDNAQIWLPQNHLRGKAFQVTLAGENSISLKNASVTSCMQGHDDWLVKASYLRLDRDKNQAVAKNARLEVFHVPVLYSPYLSFPIYGRKSGLLAPHLGNSSNSGSEFALPYYWNIAPDRDATFTPHYYSKRGTQLQSEFRYLNPSNNGKVYFEYLPDDALYNKDRGYIYLQHSAQHSKAWSSQLEYRYATDADYLNDFGGNLNTTSTEYLERRFNTHYEAQNWNANLQVLDFQTLSNFTNTQGKPYSLLPQLRFSTTDLPLGHGLQYQMNTELVRFHRQASLTGRRLDINPQLQWPMHSEYGFLTPKLALHYTRYDLQNNYPGSESNPSRTLPIFSVDSGLFFERDLHWGSAVLQTLEPRLFYLYVPYRDQSRLLVDQNGQEQTFDSGAQPLYLSQLFKENRYSGLDRIGDANQISALLSSRFYNQQGKELLAANLGQIFYFQDRRVTLPGEAVQTDSRSDLFVELRSQWAANTYTSAQLLWNDRQSKTGKVSLRFRYTPDRDRMLNLAYRYEAGSIDQADATALWPLRRQWKLVARWLYSLRDARTLQNIEGMEYNSCCWALRLVHRRYITQTDQGSYQDNIFLQFELKGLANVGSGIDRMFSEGIFN